MTDQHPHDGLAPEPRPEDRPESGLPEDGLPQPGLPEDGDGGHLEWMSEQEFDDAVSAALRRIPDELARLLTNVVVIVEEEYEPEPWEDPDTELFGLYDGIPLTERAEMPWQLPDRIVVFRGPLTRHCRSRAELEDEIVITVMHEVGHFFGIEEDRLHELGWG